MIYLIESDSFIKIGYTENIESRFIQYKTDNPNFRILDVTIGDKAVETSLQNKYKKFCLPNSEWCINKSLVFKLWKECKESIKAYTEIYDAEMWIDNHSSNKLDLKQIISITKEEWEQIIIDVDYIKYMYDL